MPDLRHCLWQSVRHMERLTEDAKKQADQDYQQLRQEKTFSTCVLAAKTIPDVPFEPQENNLKKNCMASVINLFTNLAGEATGKNTTKLDDYFEARGRFDRAKVVYSGIKVSGDRTKGSIFSQMLTKLSQYTFGGMEQLTRESTFSPEELVLERNLLHFFSRFRFMIVLKMRLQFL